MVSIIVPVYNAADYIDECIKSLVNQSYTDIEIILINDGSTDCSGQKCYEWSKIDHRIIYIDKENEGPGETRNKGVQFAKGEYIAFVDSDDWVDETYIEHLLNNIKKKSADVCFCDYYKFLSGEINPVRTTRFKEDQDFFKKLILYGNCGVTKLYRRRFLVDNHLWMPSLYHEDAVLYPVMVLCAKSVSFSDQALYYYRKRQGSTTTQNMVTAGDVIEGLRFCIRDLEMRNIYKGNKSIIEMFCVMRCMKKLAFLKPEEEAVFKSSYYSFLDENFADWRQKYLKYTMIVGSMTTRYIVSRLMGGSYLIQEHIGFSSLISQFMGAGMPEDAYSLCHHNSYRHKMIKKDLNSGLRYHNMKRAPDELYIDFLEERHDIIRTNEDNYITVSEAYEGGEIEIELEKEIIKNGTKEYENLWRESCRRFIRFIQDNYCSIKVYLIKVRLAERYESDGRLLEYESISEIREINKRIKSMEDYFICNYKDAEIVDIPEELLYTGEDSLPYGIYPWNHNSSLYDEMAWKLTRM